MNIHRYALSILVVIFSACSPFSQIVPATAPSETTIEPIATISRFTPTYEATKTLTPTSTATLQRATSTLAPDWEGIPVIPGAFKGWAAGSGWYVYQINMPVDEVEKFYMNKLTSDGLTLRYYETDVPNGYGSNGVRMEFKKDMDRDEISQISIAVYPEDNSTIIILAKYLLGP